VKAVTLIEANITVDLGRTPLLTAKEQEVGPMQDDLHLFPVLGYEMGTIPSEQCLFLRIQFLSHSLQKVPESDPGRRYVFQLQQARELRDMLSRAIQSLEAAEFHPPTDPKH
jgi:hypothetical protein